MLQDKVRSAVSQILKSDDFILLTPKSPDFGDYALFMKSETPSPQPPPTPSQSPSIQSQPLGLRSEAGKPIQSQPPGLRSEAGKPRGLNIKQLSKNDLFSKVEQKDNFINLYLNPSVLTEEMENIIKQKSDYGLLSHLKTQKIVIEFAHPNTHKIFHIGHLRNIILGEALSRVLIQSGAKVHRVNYQGDVGLHIAKCMHIIQKSKVKIQNLKTLDEKIEFLGKCYQQGTVLYETDDKAKQEINQLNKKIFEKDDSIKAIYETTRNWSLEYFDRIYSRIGTKFDRLFFESEVAQPGLTITKKALKKGILEESEGAVIFNGSKFGIDTRVFINSLGLPTYEAKELGLAELEFSEFGNIDKCIHVVTPEQTSFFKVTFKVQELLNEKKYKGKQMHFAYEFVDLKDRKMSSRQGNIVAGEWLLDEVKKKVIKTFNSSDQTAEILAKAAVKYSFLKVEAIKKIRFDIDESVSLNGNSGPYLLYTYARCMSILNKAPSAVIARSEATKQSQSISTNFNQFQHEEALLLRSLFRFPEVISDASSKYAPHLICTYLYDLAQKFSRFYEKCPILKADEDQKDFRLRLTSTTSQILKNGLNLLGIEVLDKI